MKKILAFAAALSLASSLSFVVPSVATADPTNANGDGGAVAACTSIAAFYAISEGNCVSALNGNLNANTLCGIWEGPQGVAVFGIAFPFNSFGECVSFANSNILGH